MKEDMSISTVIYYYSATGNSLYTAKALQKLLPEVELRSIPEALAEDNPSVNADCVGFVFPMHYFGLPLQVVWHTDASLVPHEPNAQWSHTGAWNWPR